MAALPASDHSHPAEHGCPRCGGRVYRTWRRPIDRFLSDFAPLQRFSCESVHCGWEGNRYIQRDAFFSHRYVVEAQESAARRSAASLPWSFVVSTSMALAGIVALLALAFDPVLR